LVQPPQAATPPPAAPRQVAALSARTPIDPASLLARGVRLHDEKDFQPALAALLAAARNNPNDPRIHAFLADTYAWLGMNAEARMAADTATRLDPNALEILRRR